MPHLITSGPEANADGYADLATAILLETVADLQGTNPQRRASARLSVQERALDPWIALLCLTVDQQLRVLALLDELVH